MKNNLEIAVFGGGCFWCLEAVFSRFKGVNKVESGYAGGEKIDPTYEEVSGGITGHIEVVKIAFDPLIISYEQLLTIFFEIHDPTSIDKQGNDVGSQYRSVIFYTNDSQKKLAEKSVLKVANAVTEVRKLDLFYTAENYHQNYYQNNKEQAYCSLIISPKIRHINDMFSGMLRY